MEKMKYDVVLLDKTSITQQVQVFKQAFGLNEPDEKILEFWEKKHYQNPLGNSLMFGVFIDGVLAGMNAYLPSTFNYQGKTIKCLQSCESGVNPMFQGKGIWGAVVRYAVEYVFSKTEYEFIFGFPNYRNSYPGFVKMKWETVSNMKNFILINNTKNFVKTLTSNKIIGAFSFPLLLHRKYVHSLSSKQLLIEECSPEELIWGKSDLQITTVPTIEWIRWKMAYKNEYLLKVTYKNDIVATCIYALDVHNKMPIVRLDRFSISDNCMIKPKTVVASVLTYLTKKHPNTAFVRIWAVEYSIDYSLLKNLHLIKLSHLNPFILKLKDDTYKNHSWNLSFYDLD